MGKRGPKKGVKYAKTLEKAEARELLRKLLTNKLEPVAEALVSRACGVRYFVTRNKTGKYEIVTDPKHVVAALNKEDGYTGEFYTDKPETAAIKELFDRTVDRPKEQEIEVKVTGELEIVPGKLAIARKRLAERHPDSQ